MSLVGLMIILSASAALCSFIAPDSVLGGFTKCTVRYTTDKSELSPYELAYLNGSVDKTKIILCEAIYDKNHKIIKEVAKYSDGSPKQTMNYTYDSNGNIIEFLLFNDTGELCFKQHSERMNDTLVRKEYQYSKDKENVREFTAVLIKEDKKLEHSTMDGKGEDIPNSLILSLRRSGHGSISTKEKDRESYRRINDSISSKYEYKYDAAGRIIETLRTDPDGEKETSINLYDKSGRLLETSVLKSDGTKELETYYKYEDNGSKTEFENNIYGTIYLRFITRYDEQGRVYEKVELHPSGEQRSIISRKFDDKNRIIEVTQTNPDDSKVGKRTFEYDKFGNRIKNVEYSPTNEVIKTVEYVYSK